MLRLSLAASSPQERLLLLHGKIADSAVELLAKQIQQHLKQMPRLVLDLDGVRFIDEAGMELLRLWVGPHLGLRGGSAFIRALLEAEGLLID